MEMQLRSWYSQQALSLALSIYRFPEDHSHRPRLQILALRYLFQHRSKDRSRCPPLSELCNRCENLFDEFYEQEESRPHANELADILGEFAPTYRNRLIDRLRLEEDEKHLQWTEYYDTEYKPNKKTVYSDSQNVHNSKVNKSVLRSAKNLYNMFKHILEPEVDNCNEEVRDRNLGRHKDDCLEQIQREFIQRHVKHSNLIRSSFKHIKTSVGTFGIDISLQDTLLALYLWIQEHENKKELELRLIEELQEMKNMCSTGHLARLVNVMQGFTDNENLLVRIDNKDQYNAVIKQYLTKSLAECKDEEVLDGMMNGTKTFKMFIHRIINDKLLEWVDDYGKNILNYIPNVVNDYTKMEVFVH